MLWLAVLTLPDGTRVESSLVAARKGDAGVGDHAYRLRLVDGSVIEFSTLISILRHLVDQYDAEALSLAASNHEAPTADLAPPAGAEPVLSTVTPVELTDSLLVPPTGDDP
jgi:hypothetical protein